MTAIPYSGESLVSLLGFSSHVQGEPGILSADIMSPVGNWPAPDGSEGISRHPPHFIHLVQRGTAYLLLESDQV